MVVTFPKKVSIFPFITVHNFDASILDDGETPAKKSKKEKKKKKKKHEEVEKSDEPEEEQMDTSAAVRLF